MLRLLIEDIHYVEYVLTHAARSIRMHLEISLELAGCHVYHMGNFTACGPLSLSLSLSLSSSPPPSPRSIAKLEPGRREGGLAEVFQASIILNSYIGAFKFPVCLDLNRRKFNSI